MKKTLLALMVFASLTGLGMVVSGCAALWVGGAVAAGATAYDVATHRECPNCRKIIKRDIPTCPYCGKAAGSVKAPEKEKDKKAQDGRVQK